MRLLQGRWGHFRGCTDTLYLLFRPCSPSCLLVPCLNPWIHKCRTATHSLVGSVLRWGSSNSKAILRRFLVDLTLAKGNSTFPPHARWLPQPSSRCSGPRSCFSAVEPSSTTPWLQASKHIFEHKITLRYTCARSKSRMVPASRRVFCSLSYPTIPNPVSRREPHLSRKWRLTCIVLFHSTNHRKG
jgi:hypothetical protein